MLYKIIQTDRFIPKKYDAFAIGPIVLVRAKAITNQALIAHELAHVKQWWRNPLMGIWYLCSAKSRYQYELEAYSTQAHLDPTWKLWMPRYILENYQLESLGLTQAKITLAIDAKMRASKT